MTDQVMEEENIFTPPKEATSDQEAKTVAPDYNQVFKDKLSTIVDDSGEQKYNDVFTALEALKHSQEYIATLQSENKMFRETKTKEDTLEQALNNISAKKEPEKTKSEGIDAEQLKGMTLEAIKEYEQSKTRSANMKQVSDTLLSKYGDAEKAKQAYAAKAEELGVDVNTLIELSAKSPKAALAFFGTTSSTPNVPKGTINSQALHPSKKDDVDYSSRYFNSSSPAVSKWKQAGENLTN